MAHVEINVEDGKGSLVVDGHDWSQIVLADGFSVDMSNGDQRPIVSLRIAAESLKLSLNGATITVAETDIA